MLAIFLPDVSKTSSFLFFVFDRFTVTPSFRARLDAAFMYASLPKEEVGDLPLLLASPKSRRFGVGRDRGSFLRLEDWREEARDLSLLLASPKPRRFRVGRCLLRREDWREDFADVRRGDVWRDFDDGFLRRAERDVRDDHFGRRGDVRGVDALRTRALIFATSFG